MQRRPPAGYARRERSAIRRDTSPILAHPFPRLSVPRSLTAKTSADFLRRRSGQWSVGSRAGYTRRERSAMRRDECRDEDGAY